MKDDGIIDLASMLDLMDETKCTEDVEDSLLWLPIRIENHGEIGHPELNFGGMDNEWHHVVWMPFHPFKIDCFFGRSGEGDYPLEASCIKFCRQRPNLVFSTASMRRTLAIYLFTVGLFTLFGKPGSRAGA